MPENLPLPEHTSRKKVKQSYEFVVKMCFEFGREGVILQYPMVIGYHIMRYPASLGYRKVRYPKETVL